MTAVLEARDLTVAYDGPDGPLPAVRALDLTVAAGEAVGLVGESGCGKSTMAFAATRHLSGGGRIAGGTLRICGEDIAALDPEALRRLRGAGVAMIYQDPVAALNPVLRIGRQLREALDAHRAPPDAEARDEITRTLARVRLPEAEAILRRYPHELSGGQIQRVVIAMALLARPRLLILDEPTTGLDVTVEASVLELVSEIAAETGMGMLYISHDIGVIARVCSRIAVMYAGRIVEEGPTAEVLAAPAHPYTRALLACLPGAGRGRLSTIPGQPPAPDAVPPGCAFAPRCAHVRPGLCDVPPAVAMAQAGPGRAARCRRLGDLGPEPAPPAGPPRADAATAPLGLSLDRVTRSYRQTGLWQRLLGRGAAPVTGADGVSFDVRRGQMVALVGESGSGKSTLARILVGLDAADAGTADWTGRDSGTADLAHLPARRRPDRLIRAVQIVFQNPDATLNPAHRIDRILGRAARRLGHRGGARAEVARLLEMVRLPAGTGRRRPGALSGGQRQRVAIARAFAGRPELVIADEPVSALDVSVQAAIVNLLADMQAAAGTAVLFISHDLALVRQVADRVVVLYRGQVMEDGTAAQVFARPQHPYTEALLSAVHPVAAGPAPKPLATTALRPDTGAGCPFAPRCHRYIGRLCDTVPPPPRAVADGHRIACHHDRAALAAAPDDPDDKEFPDAR